MMTDIQIDYTLISMLPALLWMTSRNTHTALPLSRSHLLCNYLQSQNNYGQSVLDIKCYIFLCNFCWKHCLFRWLQKHISAY